MKRIAAAICGLAMAGSMAVAGDGADGKETFLAAKCNTCHSVPSADITAKVKSEKMKGPDITAEMASTDRELLAKFLRKEAQIDGKDHSKKYEGSDEDLQKILDWISKIE